MRLASLAAVALAAAATSHAAPDATEATVVKALATAKLRAAFAAQRTGWTREAGACGGDGRCRERVAARRRAVTTALAARVSDANPTLADLAAAAFSGAWTAGPLRSLDGVPRAYPLDDGVPAAGARVSGRPGAFCRPTCFTAGLEPHPLADTADEAAAAKTLGLGRDRAAWLVYLDGRAGWLAIPARDGVALLVTACATPRHDCGPALVTLTPETPGAAIRILK